MATVSFNNPVSTTSKAVQPFELRQPVTVKPYAETFNERVNRYVNAMEFKISNRCIETRIEAKTPIKPNEEQSIRALSLIDQIEIKHWNAEVLRVVQKCIVLYEVCSMILSEQTLLSGIKPGKDNALAIYDDMFKKGMSIEVAPTRFSWLSGLFCGFKYLSVQVKTGWEKNYVVGLDGNPILIQADPKLAHAVALRVGLIKK